MFGLQHLNQPRFIIFNVVIFAYCYRYGWKIFFKKYFPSHMTIVIATLFIGGKVTDEEKFCF